MIVDQSMEKSELAWKFARNAETDLHLASMLTRILEEANRTSPVGAETTSVVASGDAVADGVRRLQ